ncbi:MAG: thiamine-phosphate kinase [Candidatus Omnitrophota bacterium]
MRVSELGEFGLIRRLKTSINLDSSVVRGPGDDCAAVKFNRSKYLLFTCDMLVEGVDFTGKDNPYLIGRKALAVSLSDIAACAGIPRYALVSVGLPRSTRLEYVDKLHQGMRGLARRYGVNLVGGDFSRSAKLTIDVSLTGEVEKRKLALRSGSKVGDIIFVSGTFGGSIRGKHLRFTPRLKEARWLADNFKVGAMIDVSDGLMQDLSHILESSRVGAVVYAGAIPLSPEARNLNDALYSGEDFELLFTLSAAEARRLVRKGNKLFRPIGRIVLPSAGFSLVAENGCEKPVKPGGFRHF